MANLAAAFGMRPIRHRNGAPYSGAARLYFTTGASALYIGDPVIVNGGGNTALYYGSPISSLPTVILATAGNGNSLTGAVIGFFPEQATSSVYNPSGASRGVFVADSPDPKLGILIPFGSLVTEKGIPASCIWTAAVEPRYRRLHGNAIPGIRNPRDLLRRSPGIRLP